MYIFFYYVFLFLSVLEVLFFIIFMLFYVVILNDVLFKWFILFYLLCVFIVIVGVVIICFDGVIDNYWFGFVIV